MTKIATPSAKVANGRIMTAISKALVPLVRDKPINSRNPAAAKINPAAAKNCSKLLLSRAELMSLYARTLLRTRKIADAVRTDAFSVIGLVRFTTN